MLILPPRLRLDKFCTFSRGWWRVGDFGDQVRRRCLGDAVQEDSDEGGFENDSEAKRKAEQYALSVHEPASFLGAGEGHATEVWFELVVD